MSGGARGEDGGSDSGKGEERDRKDKGGEEVGVTGRSVAFPCSLSRLF